MKIAPQSAGKKMTHPYGQFTEQGLSYVYGNKSFHQRGAKLIMAYFSSFESGSTAKNSGIFLNARLLPAMKLYEAMGLRDVVNKNLNVRNSKGHSDSVHVLPPILTQLGGGSALYI
jgi:hypothetical protein